MKKISMAQLKSYLRESAKPTRPRTIREGRFARFLDEDDAAPVADPSIEVAPDDGTAPAAPAAPVDPAIVGAVQSLAELVGLQVVPADGAAAPADAAAPAPDAAAPAPVAERRRRIAEARARIAEARARRRSLARARARRRA